MFFVFNPSGNMLFGVVIAHCDSGVTDSYVIVKKRQEWHTGFSN